MKEPEVRKADVSTELELPMYDAIAAGFPITSDYVAERLDFNRDFIKNPESTFFVRVKGDSMKEAGIFDGDLCLVQSLGTEKVIIFSVPIFFILRPHIFRGEMLREYAMLPSKFGKGESACNTCPEWDCWLIKAIPTARHSIPKWASCT